MDQNNKVFPPVEGDNDEINEESKEQQTDSIKHTSTKPSIRCIYQNEIDTEQKSSVNNAFLDELENFSRDRKIQRDIIDTIKEFFVDEEMGLGYFKKKDNRKEFRKKLQTYGIKHRGIKIPGGTAIQVWNWLSHGPRQLKMVCAEFCRGCCDDIKSLITKYYGIGQVHLDVIIWKHLEQIKSPSNIANQAVMITEIEMERAACMALKKWKNSNKRPNDNLIPIAVEDRAEYVFIVDAQKCNVGLSFRYDYHSKNVWVATAIYLDTAEIERKHESIGLPCNYCKDLERFSLGKFEFIDQEEYGRYRFIKG